MGCRGNPSKLVFNPPDVIGNIKGHRRNWLVESQRTKETMSLGPLSLGKGEALVDLMGPANWPRVTPGECRGHWEQTRAGEGANPLPVCPHPHCTALVQAHWMTGGPSNQSSCILDGKASPPYTRAHRGHL